MPPPFRQHHHQGHCDPDLGEHDVKAERDGHLQSGGKKVAHGSVRKLS
jgi:hypothetical protein